MRNFKPVDLMAARISADRYLYVINTSQNGPRGQKTEIVIDLVVDGRVSSLVIPVTWVPINVAELHDPKTVLSNVDFGRQVNRKNLTIVDTDEAMAFLNSGDPIVQEEVRKLHMSPRDIMLEVEGVSDEATLESKVNPQVLDICKRTDKEMSRLSKLATLQNLAGILTKEDLTYIGLHIEGAEVSKFLRQVAQENNIR